MNLLSLLMSAMKKKTLLLLYKIQGMVVFSANYPAAYPWPELSVVPFYSSGIFSSLRGTILGERQTTGFMSVP